MSGEQQQSVTRATQSRQEPGQTPHSAQLGNTPDGPRSPRGRLRGFAIAAVGVLVVAAGAILYSCSGNSNSSADGANSGPILQSAPSNCALISQDTLTAFAKGAEWACTIGYKDPSGGLSKDGLLSRAGDFQSSAPGHDPVLITVSVDLYRTTAKAADTYKFAEKSSAANWPMLHKDMQITEVQGVGDQATLQFSAATASARLYALKANGIIKVDYQGFDSTVPAGEAVQRIVRELIPQLQ